MQNRKTPVKVLPCGLVVSVSYPYLAATPDGKVIGPGCTQVFGIVEVKCPLTKFNVTPLDACSDSSFCMEADNTSCKLKESHQYFAQVQGKMGVTVQCGAILWFIRRKESMSRGSNLTMTIGYNFEINSHPTISTTSLSLQQPTCIKRIVK